MRAVGDRPGHASKGSNARGKEGCEAAGESPCSRATHARGEERHPCPPSAPGVRTRDQSNGEFKGGAPSTGAGESDTGVILVDVD